MRKRINLETGFIDGYDDTYLNLKFRFLLTQYFNKLRRDGNYSDYKSEVKKKEVVFHMVLLQAGLFIEMKMVQHFQTFSEIPWSRLSRTCS